MAPQLLVLSSLKQQLQAHLSHFYRSVELELLAHGEANVIFRLNQTRLVRVAVNTPNQRFGGDVRQVSQFKQVIQMKSKICGQRCRNTWTTDCNGVG